MQVPGYESAPDEVQLLPSRLDIPLKWAKKRHVFVNSMSDVFHPRVPFDFVLKMFEVMTQAGEDAWARFPSSDKTTWTRCRMVERALWTTSTASGRQNVWVGTSVESQKYAPRITVLARLPAPVKFVSAEPLLEAIDLTRGGSMGAISSG